MEHLNVELMGDTVNTVFKVPPQIVSLLNIPPANKTQLAHNLVVLRQAAQLSQYDLADIVGVRQSSIANWENASLSAKTIPTYGIIICAAMFDVPLEAFAIEGSDSMDVIHRQIKTVLTAKFRNYSSYNLRELLKSPNKIKSLETKFSALETKFSTLEQEFAHLKQDYHNSIQTVSSLVEEIKSLKSNSNEVINLSRETKLSSLPANSAQQLITKFLAEIEPLLAQNANLQALLISEPCLLIDDPESSTVKNQTLAVFNPDIVDVEQLTDCKVVIQDQDGNFGLREIQLFRGRYKAYALQPSGSEIFTDIEQNRIQILGKLVLVLNLS